MSQSVPRPLSSSVSTVIFRVVSSIPSSIPSRVPYSMSRHVFRVPSRVPCLATPARYRPRPRPVSHPVSPSSLPFPVLVLSLRVPSRAEQNSSWRKSVTTESLHSPRTITGSHAFKLSVSLNVPSPALQLICRIVTEFESEHCGISRNHVQNGAPWRMDTAGKSEQNVVTCDSQEAIKRIGHDEAGKTPSFLCSLLYLVEMSEEYFHKSPTVPLLQVYCSGGIKWVWGMHLGWR